METNIEEIKKDITGLVVGFVLDNREQLIQTFTREEDEEDEQIIALLRRITDYELASLLANRIDNELTSEDIDDYIIAEKLLELAIPWAKTINIDYLRSIQYSLAVGSDIVDELNE